MSIIFFTIVGIAASVAAWMLSRRLQREEAPAVIPSSARITMEFPAIGYTPPVAATPLRSANPAALADAEARVWQLQSTDGSCMLSQSLGQRRLSSRDAVALTAPACKRVDCRCYYQAVSDHRRGLRRLKVDRREQFRMDGSARPERRRRDERRRSAQQWVDRGHW